MKTLSLLKRGLLALALLIMAAHFLIYVVYAAELMRFPFDYDQGEGFELVDTIYLSEGRLPYRNNETFPFYASNYPPVYHVVLIPFVWIFGPGYWYGRLISFLGTLVTASLIGYAIYRGERQRGTAVLMGLAFLASNYIYHIGPLFRQHYFMVMFETLAVVMLAPLFELPQNEQRRRLLLGLFVLVIAGFTKQLAVFTCAAVFIWMFIRNPRRAILAGMGFGAVVGLVFLILNVLTSGEWWTNIVAANVNLYLFSQFTGLFEQFMRLHWVLIGFAVLMALYELYFARLSLYVVWFAVTFASTIGAGKWGAGDSYFATTLAATAILSGLFIARTLNGGWNFSENYLTRIAGRVKLSIPVQEAASFICLLLMIVYGLTVIKLPTSGPIFEPIAEALNVTPKPGHRYPLYDAAGWTPGYATIGHLPSQQDHDRGWYIVDKIRASEKPVLSEEAGFSIQAGREVISNPTQLLNLYDNDLLDTTSMIAMIENQGFGMIIFRARFYPDPVLAAVDNAYHPQEAVEMNGFQYELWYPEPTWETRRQIRDYLEAEQSEPLELPRPTGIDDSQQWMLDMMTHWAWLPQLELEPSQDNHCESRVFVRRGLQTTISLCSDTVKATPPTPFE